MTDIMEGLARMNVTPGALLIDLRDAEDFAEAHVPGAKNTDVLGVRALAAELADLDTPICLYCYAGMRSLQAQALLEGDGYTQVTCIGSFDGYTGETESA